MPLSSFERNSSYSPLQHMSGPESPEPYVTQHQQRNDQYSVSPPPVSQHYPRPHPQDNAEYNPTSPAPQRRPSYPVYHGASRHDPYEQASHTVDTLPDVYGHHRSQSYHGPTPDIRHVSQPSSSDTFPAYYAHQRFPDPNSHHEQMSRNRQQLPPSRRSFAEETSHYGQEIPHTFQGRQRSQSSVGPISTFHYQDSSSGSILPPSRSSQSPHSLSSPPPQPHSRSPQTPPLTPSPREYSGRAQNHQPHQYPSRPTRSTSGRVVHKTSTRESTVAPNRRMAHILSEQKRREKINGGFDELKSVIPDCAQNTDSKATILRKAVSYILMLEDELRKYTGTYDQPIGHPEPLHSDHGHEQ
ncbi:hypothetical protein BC939DRAFT_497057 [Gamsiella multidivaricata]|uniref:uncharacterized protein n=1 Tax=Gamsiella multidivaricata TaxID=101098 RepID=UPI00222046A1|nr:uncharacterized protein BC939DRAFT_497057 [Gamsiella multidivaricata]KAI7816911.1 hypothetical protein BC939DRAFT_497057 [Gamsiella multidivaricata]